MYHPALPNDRLAETRGIFSLLQGIREVECPRVCERWENFLRKTGGLLQRDELRFPCESWENSISNPLDLPSILLVHMNGWSKESRAVLRNQGVL